MKTLTFISCTVGISMSLSACGTDPVVLGELVAAAERGNGDDDPAPVPDVPAPENDPTPVPDVPAPDDDPTPVPDVPAPDDDPTPVPDVPAPEDAPIPAEPTFDPPVPDPNAPRSYEESLTDELLLQYCGECHDGPSERSGGLEVIDDVDALVALQLIIPGDREQSSVYVRMAEGTMPPLTGDPRPTADEVEFIGRFIDDMQ